MIPITTFNLMIAIFVLFIIFSLVDYANKFYANIASAVIASLFGIYLSAMIYLGAVEYPDGSAAQDLSLALILFIPTLGMMIYAYIMAYDAWDEARKSGGEDE